MATANRRSTKRASTHVALLRGINVGGKNKLPMKDLVALVTEVGGRNARTYIQSGNVVYEASAAVARRMPAALAAAIEQALGLRVPVVTRTAAEVRTVASDNPFLSEGADPKRLAVAFLAEAPGRERLASLDPNRSPPDAFVAREREIYLHLPNGAAKSKLTNAYLDSRLATTSTVRNWRTVLALVDLIEQ